MAGNGNSGRPRKPTAKLKLHGAYRDDRHGDRFDDSALSAEVVKPEGLDVHASALWDELVPTLVTNGIAKAVDVPELRGMCEWWSRYRTCMAALADSPTDYTGLMDEIDDVPRLQTMAANAWKAFSAVAAKFGLTPADRAKLASDPKPATSDFDKDITKHA